MFILLIPFVQLFYNFVGFKEHKLIWNAMLELEKVIPCVRFGNYQPSDRPVGDYIYVQKGTNNGCNSAVGRKGLHYGLLNFVL